MNMHYPINDIVIIRYFIANTRVLSHNARQWRVISLNDCY